MSPFYLIWTQNGVELTGIDDTGTPINNSVIFAINYPSYMTEANSITVQSSAQVNKTFNSLQNVKLFLTGDPLSVQIVQSLWPTLGNGYYPARTDLNGGFEISFDGGANYTRFDSSTGVEADPTTWITLPGSSIGINGISGVLGAFDTATFIVRFVIPPGAVEYQQFKIGIALDFDVI